MFILIIVQVKIHMFIKWSHGFVQLAWKMSLENLTVIEQVVQFVLKSCYSSACSQGWFTWGPESQVPLMLASPNMEAKSQLVSLE